MVDLTGALHQNISNLSISDQFQNLLLEDGLNRILKDVNFVVVKDSLSGNIREILLLSVREEGSDSAGPNVVSPVPFNEGPPPPTNAMEAPPSDTPEFPPDLPPEIRELMKQHSEMQDAEPSPNPDAAMDAPPIPPEIRELMEKGEPPLDPSSLSPQAGQPTEGSEIPPDMPPMPPEIREQMGLPQH